MVSFLQVATVHLEVSFISAESSNEFKCFWNDSVIHIMTLKLFEILRSFADQKVFTFHFKSPEKSRGDLSLHFFKLNIASLLVNLRGRHQRQEA